MLKKHGLLHVNGEGCEVTTVGLCVFLSDCFSVNKISGKRINRISIEFSG